MCLDIELNLFLEIDRNFKFDLMWLRDNCRCEECFDPKINERNLSVLDIPDDIKVKEHKVDGEKLVVKWSDGHDSVYDLSFLAKFQPEKALTPKTEICLWNRESLQEPIETSCRFSMNDVMSANSNKDILKSLIKYGVAFVEGVPSTVKNTEFIIRQLFPIKESFLGKMWTLTNAALEHPVSAYTSGYLSPHTDGTFVTDQAGLQVFHCVKHTGTGGETVIIDGFYIAEKIKQEHPDVFDRLCETNFSSGYEEPGLNYSHTAPFFNLDPVTKKMSQIRYNQVHRSPTVASSKVRQYYHDLKVLTRYVDNPENQMVFKLNPGTVMFFDNWRLLHGRTAYDGIRALTGCYIAKDEFTSAARCHGLLE